MEKSPEATGKCTLALFNLNQEKLVQNVHIKRLGVKKNTDTQRDVSEKKIAKAFAVASCITAATALNSQSCFSMESWEQIQRQPHCLNCLPTVSCLARRSVFVSLEEAMGSSGVSVF